MRAARPDVRKPAASFFGGQFRAGRAELVAVQSWIHREASGHQALPVNMSPPAFPATEKYNCRSTPEHKENTDLPPPAFPATEKYNHRSTP